MDCGEGQIPHPKHRIEQVCSTDRKTRTAIGSHPSTASLWSSCSSQPRSFHVGVRAVIGEGPGCKSMIGARRALQRPKRSRTAQERSVTRGR